MKINKEDTIMEALQKNEKTPDILAEFGMHCIGCAMSRGETIEEAANVHGLDLDEMLEKLNANL